MFSCLLFLATTPADELRQFFWNMFIADAFLGNFDRHNGNWGFLVDEEKQQAELAPVYDCGSCLYPQLDLERMKNVLQDEAEIDQRIYTFPTSSIEEGGKKISYFDYISSLKNPDCNEALKRVCSRIDLDAIHNFLEGVPELLPIQREFYLTMLTERKEKILDYSLELLMKQEQHTSPYSISRAVPTGTVLLFASQNPAIVAGFSVCNQKRFPPGFR